MNAPEKYNWKFCSLGGVTRIKLESGEDIAHLPELDEKYWTVLSCPIANLEFCAETLALLDADSDGKIRVPEVMASIRWITGALKNRDALLEGSDALRLADLDESDAVGARLASTAQTILSDLGLQKDEVSL